MISFKNDYSEGACPEVLEALVKTQLLPIFPVLYGISG